MMRTRYSRAAWSSSVPTAAPGRNERGWARAMAGEASDEEAAWRDLVAQYSTPAAADGAAPWPVREELPSARQPPPGAPGSLGAAGTPGTPGDGHRAAAGDGGEDPDAAQAHPQEWADPVPGVIP